MEDRGSEPRARGLGNLSGDPASPMRKAKKAHPRPKKAKQKAPKSKPAPSHKRDFETLLDLAVRGEKRDN